jgi:hypothetical protein
MDIINELRDRKIPLQDWGYIMRLARVPAEHIDNYVSETIEKNMKEALEFYWGKPEADVTLEDLALKKAGMVQ